MLICLKYPFVCHQVPIISFKGEVVGAVDIELKPTMIEELDKLT